MHTEREWTEDTVEGSVVLVTLSTVLMIMCRIGDLMGKCSLHAKYSTRLIMDCLGHKLRVSGML